MNNPNKLPAHPRNRNWKNPCILHVNGLNVHAVTDLEDVMIRKTQDERWYVSVWTSDLLFIKEHLVETKTSLGAMYDYPDNNDIVCVLIEDKYMYVPGEEPYAWANKVWKVKYSALS